MSDARAFRRALDQAGQHLAGADFDEQIDALAVHEAHAFAPAHRAADLGDQQLANFIRVARRRGGDIGDEGNDRRA